MGKCVEGEKSDKQSFLREFISTAGHLSFTWSDMKHRLIGRRRAKKVLALFGGLGIELIGDRARKFDTENAQTAYAHFNLKILGRVTKGATGMFADLMKQTDQSKVRP